jgi:hypothetical protein
MESWHFIPKVGITSSIGRISFGDSPTDVEKLVSYTCHHMNHDICGTGASLKLEYDHQDRMIYIVFCEGSLILDDTEIFNITKPQLKRYLKKKGFTFRKAYPYEGEYCPDIHMEFASSKDNGGETSMIGSIGMFYGEDYWEQFK